LFKKGEEKEKLIHLHRYDLTLLTLQSVKERKEMNETDGTGWLSCLLAGLAFTPFIHSPSPKQEEIQELAALKDERLIINHLERKKGEERRKKNETEPFQSVKGMRLNSAEPFPI